MQLSRQHFRRAARSFVRHKGFSIVAVSSLGLAIALNTTMYSVIDALVNPRLEIHEPKQLYRLTIWGDAHHRIDDATRASILRSGFDTYEAMTLFGGTGGAFRERQLRVLSARMAALLGVTPKTVWFQLSPIRASQFRFNGFHFALIGAVIAVLLIRLRESREPSACPGHRTESRAALRAALGASRRDIIVQLLLESAMLGGVGFILGLLMTFLGMSLLDSTMPPRVAYLLTSPQTSWRVLRPRLLYP
jgi:hypothetical protein